MSWNRVLVLLAVVLVVLGGLAFAGFTPVLASIAGDVLEPEEPEADEQLVMEPHPGPNGEYASINEDGEIEIVADAVNPTSQSNVSDVFTIWNNASSVAQLNISHDNEAVVVFDSNATDGFGDIQTEEGITLAPDETVSVGFHIDPVKTSAGETLLESVTFQAEWMGDDGSSSTSSTTEPTTGDSVGAFDSSDDDSGTEDEPSDVESQSEEESSENDSQTDDDSSGDESKSEDAPSDDGAPSEEDAGTSDDRETSDDDLTPIGEFAGFGGSTLLLFLGILGGAVGIAHLVGRST